MTSSGAGPSGSLCYEWCSLVNFSLLRLVRVCCSDTIVTYIMHNKLQYRLIGWRPCVLVWKIKTKTQRQRGTGKFMINNSLIILNLFWLLLLSINNCYNWQHRARQQSLCSSARKIVCMLCTLFLTTESCAAGSQRKFVKVLLHLHSAPPGSLHLNTLLKLQITHFSLWQQKGSSWRKYSFPRTEIGTCTSTLADVAV